MLPLCADQGVGVIPWSPLARGRLTRDWDATTARSETDEFGETLYRDEDRGDRRRRRRGRRAARGRRAPRSRWPGCSPSRWSTSPIVGATKPQHLERRRGRGRPRARRDDEVEELGAGYVPHADRRAPLTGRPADDPGSGGGGQRPGSRGPGGCCLAARLAQARLGDPAGLLGKAGTLGALHPGQPDGAREAAQHRPGGQGVVLDGQVEGGLQQLPVQVHHAVCRPGAAVRADVSWRRRGRAPRRRTSSGCSSGLPAKHGDRGQASADRDQGPGSTARTGHSGHAPFWVRRRSRAFWVTTRRRSRRVASRRAVRRGTVAPHDHAVSFHDGDRTLGVVASYVADGLALGEPVVVVATADHLMALDAALARARLGPGSMRADGRFRTLDAEETLAAFMVDGRPRRRGLPGRASRRCCTRSGATHRGSGSSARWCTLLWDEGNSRRGAGPRGLVERAGRGAVVHAALRLPPQRCSASPAWRTSVGSASCTPTSCRRRATTRPGRGGRASPVDEQPPGRSCPSPRRSPRCGGSSAPPCARGVRRRSCRTPSWSPRRWPRTRSATPTPPSTPRSCGRRGSSGSPSRTPAPGPPRSGWPPQEDVSGRGIIDRRGARGAVGPRPPARRQGGVGGVPLHCLGREGIAAQARRLIVTAALCPALGPVAGPSAGRRGGQRAGDAPACAG